MTNAYVRSTAEGLADGAACLEAALNYVRLGWSVLCLCPPDHIGVGIVHSKTCQHPGKRPLPDGGRWKEWQETASDEATVRRWWGQHPNANVGLALGPMSGLVRLDVEGQAAEARLAEVSGGDLPSTLEFSSGKGRGLLYALPMGIDPEACRTGVEGLPDGELRIQGLGAQTVLPPSRHNSGRLYAWLPGHGPKDVVSLAPAWLLARLAAGTGRPFGPALADGEVIPKGHRDDTLMRMGCSMRNRGFGESAIRNALSAENLERCDPPLDDWQVAKIAHSVARYEPDAYVNATITRSAPGVNGQATPPKKPIHADDVATIADLVRAGAEVRWLWPGWVPLGVLTAVAAPAGTGKTRFVADLVRRVRTGMVWPDGHDWSPPPDSSGCLALWVMSDNHHDEMVTLTQTFSIAEVVRLNADRVDPYGGVTLETKDDYDALEARVKAVRPVMVVVDTVGNATDLNLGKQEDAKEFYAPLQVIARKYRCALLCVTHLNVGGQFLGRRVLEKVRVALRIEQCDPKSEKRRLEVVKSFSKKPAALGLTMTDSGNNYDDQPPERADGEARPTRARLSQETEAAAKWLRNHLSRGPQRVSYTRTDATTAGISVGTLYNAMRLLSVEEFESEGRKWWKLTVTEDEQ